MKTCTKCLEEKEYTLFSKRTKSSDGYKPICKACERAYQVARAEHISKYYKEYNSENKERVLAKRAEYRAANKEILKEKRKAYYAANREKELAKRAEYQKQFPDKCNAVQAKRRSNKLQATPAWAELKIIEQIYSHCQVISATSGEQHHVHHIVPLVNPLVCGLHCVANLAIIPGKENTSLGNRVWPDMP